MVVFGGAAAVLYFGGLLDGNDDFGSSAAIPTTTAFIGDDLAEDDFNDFPTTTVAGGLGDVEEPTSTVGEAGSNGLESAPPTTTPAIFFDTESDFTIALFDCTPGSIAGAVFNSSSGTYEAVNLTVALGTADDPRGALELPITVGPVEPFGSVSFSLALPNFFLGMADCRDAVIDVSITE